MVWAGEFGDLQDAKKRLEIVVPISLVLIIGLLYCLFNSMLECFLTLSGIPFAIAGGVLALYVSGLNFSISAAIGFVSLFGVSVMNGILLITYYNQARLRGGTPMDAMFHAASTRMRPLLMTSLSACIGLFPAAISTGIGSQVQRPLATVIVGGMLVGPDHAAHCGAGAQDGVSGPCGRRNQTGGHSIRRGLHAMTPVLQHDSNRGPRQCRFFEAATRACRGFQNHIRRGWRQSSARSDVFIDLWWGEGQAPLGAAGVTRMGIQEVVPLLTELEPDVFGPHPYKQGAPDGASPPTPEGEVRGLRRKALSLLSLTGLAVAWLAGCAVGPDFKKPAAPEVDGYTSAPLSPTSGATNLAGGESQQFLSGNDIPGAWWTLFHSKPLNDLLSSSPSAREC